MFEQKWHDLPGYQILDVIGHGGMGMVLAAWHNDSKRLVALKMPLAMGALTNEQMARFRREADALVNLKHPNIVQIVDAGEHRGQPYIAMEYVEGASLDRKLSGNTVPSHEAAKLVKTMARAVHCAHQRGILHRDLKPANVLLTAEGTPKLTDFGLAKRWGEQPGQPSLTSLTPSGAVLGTPSYMAPEQASGESDKLGPAADVYSLGAMLYELLTGRPPFRAETPLDTLLQVLESEPERPSRIRADVSPELEAICMRCLEKEPGKRYASAEALADDLDRFVLSQANSAVNRSFGSWLASRKILVLGWGFGGLAALALILCGSWYERHRRDTVSENAKLRKALDIAEEQRTLTQQDREAESEKARIALDQRAEFLRTQANELHRLKQMAASLTNGNKRAEAEEALRQEIASAESLLDAFPGVAQILDYLADAQHDLGHLLEHAGRATEAEEHYIKAKEVLVQLVAEFADDANHRSILADVLMHLAQRHRDRGELSEARELLDQAVQHSEAAFRVMANSSDYRRYLRVAQCDLADTLVRLGDHAGAAVRLTEVQRLTPERSQECRQAAGLLARCASLALSDDQMAPEQRAAVARTYGDRAIELLRESRKRGFNDVADLKNSPELDPLRDRDDFKELLAGSEPKAP